MTKLWIDIETYSTVDLRQASVYRYVEDPEFLILMAAWALDDDPVQVAIGAEEIDAIPGLWDVDEVELRVAHNAGFERVCFSRFAFLNSWDGDADWPVFMPPEMWECTMALAAENGLPQSLEKLGEALDGEKKDQAGTALVNFFCRPNRKGERNLPEDHPEKWTAFVEYCRQDVVTMRDAATHLTPMTLTERRLWEVDQRINDRGIRVDRDMTEAAIRVSDDNRMEQELEVWALSGIDNPGSVQQVMEWLHRNGTPLVNLRAETVEKALEGDLPDLVRKVLELRQELALVAQKKYLAAHRGISADDRLRGQFRFFGAHTGRWSGKGVQLQNLPQRGTIKMTPDEIAEAIAKLKAGDPVDSVTLKSLVRPMFVGPFDVFDYASIEARVIAWLAGEEWALKAFKDGRDIYVETAERMGGLTRAEGKIAVLALGYNGGINSLKALGGGGLGDDKALQKLVTQWRRANPNIVAFWGELGAALRVGNDSIGDGWLSMERDGDDRLMRLPSGRAIVYRDVRHKMVEGPYGPTSRASFRDPRNTFRTDTYGGRLAENATQAIARDVLADALIRLDEAGIDVVAHVHDEVLIESSPSRAKLVKELMSVSPDWAPGLPIDAEGFYTDRYRKE